MRFERALLRGPGAVAIHHRSFPRFQPSGERKAGQVRFWKSGDSGRSTFGEPDGRMDASPRKKKDMNKTDMHLSQSHDARGSLIISRQERPERVGPGCSDSHRRKAVTVDASYFRLR